MTDPRDPFEQPTEQPTGSDETTAGTAETQPVDDGADDETGDVQP